MMKNRIVAIPIKMITQKSTLGATHPRITFILTLFLLLFCAPQVQVDSEAQITMKKCAVCGRPVSNCDYHGNHPKCSVCGKVKERCPYRCNHPKCSVCGKLKENCQYNGNHPKCLICGKYKDQCPYKGNHPKDKETYTANGVSFTMIWVEGNGSPYYIGETEVTQELWQAVMGSNPSYFMGNQRPVENVNCDDCDQFIRKLNSITGKTFRLPSESEWEYAAKGGKYTHNYTYSGSNNIDEVAWYDKNAWYCGSSSANTNHPDYGTHPVKSKKANELSIYDMSGNVWEWTSTTSGSRRVNRGGSWFRNSLSCAVSYRSTDTPTHRLKSIGLRLAL